MCKLKLLSAETVEAKIIKVLVECMVKHRPLNEVADKVLCALHDIPAVDAVEVVRCKDCVHSEEAAPLSEGVLYCNTNDLPFPEDGYCNRGIRKENAE